ncbi:MAG TPA: 2OG-Fe(II) oxygenase [Terriglobales bacterium]|nr:2OG-Fe(II) oxygenase [Terriglobales bacterium]
MANPIVTPATRLLFPYVKWSSQLPTLRRQFRDNQPYPHVHLKDFLDREVAAEISSEFPDMATDAWTRYKHQNENKLGLAKREMFPQLLGEVVDELNSDAFVHWLSELTGIPKLVSDDMLEGGGLHQSTTGGFLNVHTDFSNHHYHKHWRRQVNLILYLNPKWDEQWGGALELWDREMRHCVTRVPPLFNDALIFRTDEISYHGFPDPLRCPPTESRKSLALYYYTVESEGEVKTRSTNYRPRPEDGVLKSSLIWLDKEAVDLYSRAKARFGFSDELASKILGFLSRKR